MQRFLLFCLVFFSLTGSSLAQTGEVRGFVFDKETGEPVIYTNVVIRELKLAIPTDLNGFYSITKIKPGNYTLYISYIGYDSISIPVTIVADKIITRNVYLKRAAYELEEFSVSAEKVRKKEDPNVSSYKITQKELKTLPTVGGEPDLVQYLQVLPGVVFTGDQGGQVYIRGGSPVMNKVLIDGMTIYNPFHSIGLFSVFDADIIQNADVYSAGFGAQYGGRISAIIDITTREGNKKRLGGKLAVNPFTSKVMLEGPLRKFKEGGGSSSFIISYKNSYLEQSSKTFYRYADPDRLPYNFQDFYSKVSFNSANGSKMNLFGFSYKDQVNFPGTTQYSWDSKGFGGKFLLIPDESKTIIDGFFAWSNYAMQQKETDNKPRNSSINGFNVGLNFGYFIKKDELKYGIEINGFTTKFQIINSANRIIDQDENTTEIGGWFKYRKNISSRLILEPSLRIMYYASLSEPSVEPRFSAKFNATPSLRFKIATGIYSQNLLSAVSDRDVVNLFYGFLSGPDNLPRTFRGNAIESKLQKARHYVVGLELDVTKHSDINFEVYLKDFTQLSNINREKIFDDDEANASRPDLLKKDFIREDGKAYGFDIRYKYDLKRLYIWVVYSFNIVTRRDEIQTYNPHFDRRHNVNIVGSYTFGKDKSFEINGRWNFGSGFPFTQTAGFYENLSFQNGVNSNYTSANGDMNIYYGKLNAGRLPTFHRLDLSAQKKFKTGKNSMMTVIASCTNVYNRDNVFYFDRVKYKRVNQLPMLPTLGVNFNF